MRAITAAIVATTMLASSAFAAGNAPLAAAAPLAAGKPAGVKQAQGLHPWIGPVVLGGAVISILVYALIYNTDHPAASAAPSTGP